MKIFGKEIQKTTFITVTIGKKCYDYPKDIPLPRVGEIVSIDSSEFGRVTRVLHQMMGKGFRMISIETEIE